MISADGWTCKTPASSSWAKSIDFAMLTNAIVRSWCHTAFQLTVFVLLNKIPLRQSILAKNSAMISRQPATLQFTNGRDGKKVSLCVVC